MGTEELVELQILGSGLDGPNTTSSDATENDNISKAISKLMDWVGISMALSPAPLPQGVMMSQ